VALVVLLAVALLACGFTQDAAAAHKKTKKAHARSTHASRYLHHTDTSNRYAAIVIDAATGTVLSQKDPDKKLYPASLTKMMTLYLTFNALENGTLRRNDRIPVSAHASVQEPSALGLESGSTIRVEDAILALVTKSANDVAVTLGEAIGGSEGRFGGMMSAKARALGMTNTRFVNASGLYDPAQVSSARDMAKLGLALIKDFPREYRYFSTARFTWAGKTFDNHNKLMATYNGMDGIKTGYVHQSGFNLVASAVRNDRRLIGVIFGGKTTASRNAQMRMLLDQGFTHLDALRLASASPSQQPKFDAMGLVMKGSAEETGEGDSSDDSASDEDTDQAFTEQFRPKPISTKTLGAYKSRALKNEEDADEEDKTALQKKPQAVIKTASASEGSFIVQIGSFKNQASGMKALQHAQKRLPKKVKAATTPIVVPLATSRGTIYRARLTGLDKRGADNVCRVLKGNCLVLTTQ
jgi:D-alanyl-D-alanine carboxypeptidase